MLEALQCCFTQYLLGLLLPKCQNRVLLGFTRHLRLISVQQLPRKYLYDVKYVVTPRACALRFRLSTARHSLQLRSK